MITEKQAKIMAQQYCEENQANLFVYHGFVAGVDAALNVLLPEINAKRAENTRLNIENAAIAGERDAAILENDRLRDALNAMIVAFKGREVYKFDDEAIFKALNALKK